MTPERRAAPGWPGVLLPAPGCFPLALPGGPDERVLHVALRVAGDPQAALERALRGIATEYAEVVWTTTPIDRLEREVLEAAARIRPTLVFMQIQTAGIVRPGLVGQLRAACAPDALVVQWDGDQHFAPRAPERAWFVELGRDCDASLICNTAYPPIYAELGVRHPGYLQIGVDAQLWRPRAPAPCTPQIVLLATHYPTEAAYRRRLDVAQRLTRAYPGRFAAYGKGWDAGAGVTHRAFLAHEDEAPVYSAAWAALSISICNDLPRYTSDRLFRVMAAGALPLVERFPDHEGLGLDHGVNCLIWQGWEQLRPLVDEVLRDYYPAAQIRAAARELALAHTWDARMGELRAILAAVRAGRGAA